MEANRRSEIGIKNFIDYLDSYEIKNIVNKYDNVLYWILNTKVDKIQNISINKSLYSNKIEMEIEKNYTDIIEDDKENNQLLIESLEYHCKEIQSILEVNSSLELPDDFFNFIANKVKGVLNTPEVNQLQSETRLNDLGLPMHPLEIEVADMIEQAKQGKRVFPKYDRKVDETPLRYLEKYFGKYLKAFGAEEDYLYQHQLQAIDAKFRNNLRMYLSYHGMDISNFISTKSKLIDKEVELLGIANIGSRKIFNLAQAR